MACWGRKSRKLVTKYALEKVWQKPVAVQEYRIIVYGSVVV